MRRIPITVEKSMILISKWRLWPWHSWQSWLPQIHRHIMELIWMMWIWSISPAGEVMQRNLWIWLLQQPLWRRWYSVLRILPVSGIMQTEYRWSWITDFTAKIKRWLRNRIIIRIIRYWHRWHWRSWRFPMIILPKKLLHREMLTGTVRRQLRLAWTIPWKRLYMTMFIWMMTVRRLMLPLTSWLTGKGMRRKRQPSKQY